MKRELDLWDIFCGAILFVAVLLFLIVVVRSKPAPPKVEQAKPQTSSSTSGAGWASGVIVGPWTGATGWNVLPMNGQCMECPKDGGVCVSIQLEECMKEAAIPAPAPKPPAKRKAKPSEKADMDFVHPDYLSNVPVVIGEDDQALIGFPSISSGSVMVCPAKGAKTGKEWRELPVGTIRLSECAVSIAPSAPEPPNPSAGDECYYRLDGATLTPIVNPAPCPVFVKAVIGEPAAPPESTSGALTENNTTWIAGDDSVMCMGKNLVDGCPNYDPHGCRSVFADHAGHWNPDKQSCEVTLTFLQNYPVICSALIDRTITCTYTPAPEGKP
jgi:hypothetical protein